MISHTGLTPVLDLHLSIPVVGGPSLSISYMGTYIVFVSRWLPYMILPTQAALERVPNSLLEASADLGGGPARTFRSVILPLALPGMVDGSIFTFALTRIETDFAGAFLTGADLTGADLTGACLIAGVHRNKVRLHRATYDAGTRWPEGFNPKAAGVIFKPPV